MYKEAILTNYRNRGEDFTWSIYQPINFHGYEITIEKSGRKCFDRLEFIRAQLKKDFGEKKLKILDIGCNLGFFCFELAKDGHSVVGIDSNQKYVDWCHFIKSDCCPDLDVDFQCSQVDFKTLDGFGDYDVVLCFSVMHHIPPAEKLLSFQQLAKRFPYSIIEVDGPDLGEIFLKTFYYDVENIGEANDPYGKSTKRRVLWKCSNEKLKPCKEKNDIFGRGVFSNDHIVIKRQKIGLQHTWINTDIYYERDFYLKHRSRFFADFIDFKESGKYAELKISKIKNVGEPSKGELLDFFSYLRENSLFIVDFTRDMFLFDEQNQLKVIDLESVVDHNSISISNFIKRDNKALPYNSYSSQLEFLKKHFKL